MPGRRTNKQTGMSSGQKVSSEVVSALRNQFKRHANKTYAAQQRKYMRNKFSFYGIRSPQLRLLTKEVIKEHGPLDGECVWRTVELCWQEEEREMQYVGCNVASQHRAALDTGGAVEAMTRVQRLIVEKSWWDTVDMLASHVVGHLMSEHPDEVGPVLDQWVTGPNMWLRRTAILHQLQYKQRTDQARLFRYCLLCCHENEFFIQKAIGWSLREYHKTRPREVEKFVRQNKAKLAKLSVREALKHSNIALVK